MNFVIWLLITCFTKAEEVEEKNEAEFSRNSRLCRLYWLTSMLLLDFLGSFSLPLLESFNPFPSWSLLSHWTLTLSLSTRSSFHLVIFFLVFLSL